MYPTDMPFIAYALFSFWLLRFLKTADAVLLANSHAWEYEAIDAIDTWFSDWGKSVYCIGPLLPSNFGVQQQSDGAPNGVIAFLDSMVQGEGKRSVILVRVKASSRMYYGHKY